MGDLNPIARHLAFRSFQRLLMVMAPVFLGGILSSNGEATGPKPDVLAQRASLQAEADRSVDWQLAESEHFFLLTDVRDADFIEELKLRLEAIQLVFETDFPAHEARASAKKTRAPKGLVRVFRSRDEYLAHGGPAGSAGFWSPSSGELALRAQLGAEGLRQTWSTLNHEAFHQYIYFHLGEQTPHAWFGEGYGDFYGRYRFVNGSYERPLRPCEHVELEATLDSGEHATLRDFIRWTKGEYYGTNDLGLSRDLAYAQGCSLIHFLRSGSEVFPEGWQNYWEYILPRYQQSFARTGKPEAALLSAFEGVNLIALENCWKHFLLTS